MDVCLLPVPTLPSYDLRGWLGLKKNNYLWSTSTNLKLSSAIIWFSRSDKMSQSLHIGWKDRFFSVSVWRTSHSMSSTPFVPVSLLHRQPFLHTFHFDTWHYPRGQHTSMDQWFLSFCDICHYPRSQHTSMDPLIPIILMISFNWFRHHSIFESR